MRLNLCFRKEITSGFACIKSKSLFLSHNLHQNVICNVIFQYKTSFVLLYNLHKNCLSSQFLFGNIFVYMLRNMCLSIAFFQIEFTFTESPRVGHAVTVFESSHFRHKCNKYCLRGCKQLSNTGLCYVFNVIFLLFIVYPQGR